jgi:hypothetical protein
LPLPESPNSIAVAGDGANRSISRHRRHRRLVAPQLRQRAFAVARQHDVIGVEVPAQLLLQPHVVFDNQQLLLCRGATP